MSKPFDVPRVAVGMIALLVLTLIAVNAQTPAPADSPQAFLNQYCTSCHNPTMKSAQLDLRSLDSVNVASHAEVWEKVVRKLRTGMMPPSNAPRSSRTRRTPFRRRSRASPSMCARSAPRTHAASAPPRTEVS